MGETPLPVSLLNDFIFCPASIYFHMVDAEAEKLSYDSTEQPEGGALHEKTDSGEYSDRADVLQGVPVYCERYNLGGKIDVFEVSKRILAERKRKISFIYDGYHFQLYA